MNVAVYFAMNVGTYVVMNEAGMNVSIYFAMNVGIYVVSLLVCMFI